MAAPLTTIPRVRGITLAKRELLASAHYQVYGKVLIENGAGEEVDYGDFADVSWFRSARWSLNIDQAVSSGTAELWRSIDELSLAPLMRASLLNRDAAGQYSPAANPGRRIRVLAAVAAPGVPVVAGDWVEMFIGRLDEADWKDEVLALQYRDLGAWLIETQIQEERTYFNLDGSPMPIEDLSQRIIDDWPVKGSPTLYVVGDPAWVNVKHVQKADVSVMEALTEIWGQIGWVCRYMPTAHGYQLVAFEPNRDNPPVDVTFGPDEYLEITDAKFNDSGVRNDFLLPYVNAAGEAQPPLHYLDAVSEAEFGNRFMRMRNPQNIDTAVEANRLLSAVSKDLSTIELTHGIKLRFFPYLLLHDYCAFLPNGVHYDEEQRAAAQVLSFELLEGGGFVTMGGAGRPRGAYSSWLFRGVRGGRGGEPVIPDIPPFVPVITVEMVSSSPVETVYAVSAAAPSGEAVSLYTTPGGQAFGAAGPNPVVVTIPRATVDQQQLTVDLWAVSESGGEDRDSITADFDEVPGFGYINRPEPLLAANEQVGWSQSGNADEDARGIYIKVVSGSIDWNAASVPWVAVGGTIWLDVHTLKLWSTQWLQDPGRAAEIEIYATEFYGPTLAPGGTLAQVIAAAGVIGPVFKQRMARAPVTEMVPRDTGSSTRALLFTPNPPGSTLRYRIGGDTGVWKTVDNATTVREDVSVAVSDVIVEFYSVSVEGEVEPVHRVVLDRNNDPDILDGTTFREIRPNVIGQQLILDDEVLTWETYGRRAASPRDRSGAPIARYRIDGGTRLDPDMEWWADGNGGPDSIWFIYVRAADGHGRYTEKEYQVEVGTGAAALGYLSNVRALVSEEGPGFYNEVLFNSSEQIDADPLYTVDVYSNGALVAEDRNARLDHDDTLGVAGEGGWHLRVAAGEVGQVYVGPLFFTFDVVLKYAGDVVATYRATLTSNYVGDGVWEDAPAEVPPFVGLQRENLDLRASWEPPPSARYLTDIQFATKEADDPDYDDWSAPDEVARGVTEYLYPNPYRGQTGRYYRARIRWRTNGGWGEWSVPSAGSWIPGLGHETEIAPPL